MGVFDDKKFEELDWISQATEPIDSQMNEILGKVPETFNIDFKTYQDLTEGAYSIDISLSKVISFVTNKFAYGSNISYQQRSALEQCFQLEFSTDEIILDFERQMIYGGEITLVKLNSTMDEKVLEGMLGGEGIDALSYLALRNNGALSRMNEVMELLGKCEAGLKTRSERRKRHTLLNRLRTLFKTNEWKIKDTELANKVGLWIRDYINDGNLAAFSNFCRLKVMTHKDQPIYSMEEVK
jgi:hypothetical protein